MKRYMVFYDDGYGLASPMGWSDEEAGVLVCSDRPASFGSRAAARKAMRISTRYAQLRREQGRGHEEAWIDDKKSVRILAVDAECTPAEEMSSSLEMFLHTIIRDHENPQGLTELSSEMITWARRLVDDLNERKERSRG